MNFSESLISIINLIINIKKKLFILILKNLFFIKLVQNFSCQFKITGIALSLNVKIIKNKQKKN